MSTSLEAFVLRLARALHESGAPSHRLEDTMAALVPRLGIEARFFSTPTSIFISFGPGAESRTTLLRVEPAGVDLERMRLVDDVVVGLRDGRLGVAEATARLDAIEAKPERYGPVVSVLAFALAAATVARFLGGGAREIAAAALVGGQTGIFAIVAGGRREAGRLLDWIASFAAAAAAVGWAIVFGPLVPAISALAGLIVLLPGLTLTVALTELATRQLVSGTARLAGAGITFLALGFGMALGSRLEPLAGARAVVAPLAPLPAWTEWFALALSPLALTVLFRARPRDVFVIGAGGFLAYVVLRLAGAVAGAEIGMLTAAFATGVLGNVYARVGRGPAAVAIVPALILLVPGSLGVRGVTALLSSAEGTGPLPFLTLIVLTTALAAGILLANLAVPPRRSL